MVKVRFFITSLGGGGAEKVLINVLKQLEPSEYQVSLMTLFGGLHADEIPNNVKQRMVFRKNNLLCRLLMKLPPRLFALLFLRENYDFEVAYLEGWPTRVVAALHTNAKKIAFVHCDISVRNPLRKLYRSNEACLKEYKRYSTVCFVSDDCKQGFEKIVGKLDNACIVYNVQDYDAIDKLSQEPCEGFETTGLKILSVGRLSPEKGYDRLLKIVSRLEKNYLFELIIIGEGSERRKLENIISDQQISSVILLGYRANPYPYYKNADLYLCSSHYEGYSTTCLESIYLNLPVLTTDCAGMKEILDNGNFGLIVDNTTDALEKGLRYIFENPERLRLYRENIAKRKSNQVEIEEYKALFEPLR